MQLKIITIVICCGLALYACVHNNDTGTTPDVPAHNTAAQNLLFGDKNNSRKPNRDTGNTPPSGNNQNFSGNAIADNTRSSYIGNGSSSYGSGSSYSGGRSGGGSGSSYSDSNSSSSSGSSYSGSGNSGSSGGSGSGGSGSGGSGSGDNSLSGSSSDDISANGGSTNNSESIPDNNSNNSGGISNNSSSNNGGNSNNRGSSNNSGNKPQNTPRPVTPVAQPKIAPTESIKWTDNGKPLTNPGMGFNQMYYTFDDVQVPDAVPTDELNTLLDELNTDIVSYRVSWAKMEPVEGQYNWAYIEDSALPLVAKGKKIALKFYTNFLCDHPERQATPLWVRDAGAKGAALDCDGNSNNNAWGAYYNDPVLLAKLEKFYRAAAERYDDRDWVSFIELGSIGRVGEGNSYQVDALPHNFANTKLHIDLLRKTFPETQLLINDDMGKEAAAYALTQGYGVDDHSISVDKTATTDGRSWNKAVLSLAQGKAPIGLEIDTFLKPSAFYRKNIIESGANFARLHSNPRYLVQDSAAMNELRQAQLAIGYRLQFPQIDIPGSISAGQTYTIRYTVRNAGAGYGFVVYQPVFELRDAKGNILADTRDKGFVLPSLLPTYGKSSMEAEQNTQSHEVSLSVPSDIPSSGIQLVLTVQNTSGSLKINLPYAEHSTAQGVYVLKQY